MSGIVIVGGGQAGFSVLSSLINQNYAGQITIICYEKLLPYQRPPLSKKFLLGLFPKERLFFRPASFYKENNINLKLGSKVLKIYRGAKKIKISDQSIINYDKLILTTGATPNTFPKKLGGNLKGVYYLRSVADVEQISPELKPDRRILIIGGGYIGLEIAAVVRRKKLNVTLVEAEDRILKRVASGGTSQLLKRLHEKEKVKILEGVSITKLEGKKGVLSSAILDNGKQIMIDLAIVGIGVKPDVELAAEAGLALDNGIKVNSYCWTSDSNILAAGDCTSFPHDNGRIRLESVGNAIDQGEIAALNAMGYKRRYMAKPWFWSDQYETKLQIAGLSDKFDKVVERIKDNGVSFWYYRGDKLIAVDSINDGKAYMIGKKLIEQDISPDQVHLSDTTFDLKLLLKRF